MTSSTKEKKMKNVPYRMQETDHRNLKVFCAQHGIAMQQLLDKAVQEYLKKWAV
ncbi:hypothetical protein [Paenibacillus lactis]|uniref:hypothetical protein n=1 Tax=Paenibacillus lactis TaxID=228574 RepID=UPI003673E1EC